MVREFKEIKEFRDYMVGIITKFSKFSKFSKLTKHTIFSKPHHPISCQSGVVVVHHKRKHQRIVQGSTAFGV